MNEWNTSRKMSAANTMLASATVLSVSFLLAALPGTPQPSQQPATNAPRAGEVKVNSKDGLKYVWIPPGTFTMGCSPGDSECFGSEKPAHSVTISKGFWIGQTEVTVGAYKRFVAAMGKDVPTPPDFNAGWANDNLPIANVSWNDSQAYCQWSSGRLPTEAEREYAARGGSTEARYGPLDEVAWYGDNSGRQRLDSAEIWRNDSANYVKRLDNNGSRAHEVGEKRANEFGLYDTLGNVWEWVNDWYDGNYYQNSPAQDPPGPSSGQYRVLRGGSWSLNPRGLRLSGRNDVDPAGRGPTTGLRCVGPANLP
jgi:formylglycine-generating enzyme required for sulfatase activity